MDESKIQLEFVFKEDALSSPRTFEDFYCISTCMATPTSFYAKNVLNPQFSMKSTISITSAPISESVLKQKYLKNHLSTRQIAKEFSCSKTKIRNLLLKYKIPLREPSKYHHKYNSCIYGKKKVNGKIIDHKRELQVIETIKKLYVKGINPNSIAKVLSTMKIPTKQRKKDWHHRTIIKLLKREKLYKTKVKSNV